MRKRLHSKRLMEIYDTDIARTYNTLPVVLTRGKGAKVWDKEGKVYLDFWAAYSALNLGHSHPEIIETAISQLKKGAMLTRACYNDQLALLAHELREITGFEMMIPKNSGAEAVETALKAARMYAYRKRNIPQNRAEIIACEGNFHGRTITVISFSSEPAYKDDFGPYTPGFKLIPFNDAQALERAIDKNTIAFLVEPIQCEGGLIIPSDDYLKKVRQICDRKNILLILDEIQTGLGRTGKLFCFEHSGVKPDILILGKSLGGGVVPISAVLARREIMQYFKPGDDGSTFGGYSLAAAVARKALEIIIEKKLPERAAKLGQYFITELKKIKSPYIKEIRGRGLLAAIELKPEAGGARRFCNALINERLICKECHEHILRLSPPLIISKKQLDFGIQKIKKIF